MISRPSQVFDSIIEKLNHHIEDANDHAVITHLVNLIYGYLNVHVDVNTILSSRGNQALPISTQLNDLKENHNPEKYFTGVLDVLDKMEKLLEGKDLKCSAALKQDVITRVIKSKENLQNIPSLLHDIPVELQLLILPQIKPVSVPDINKKSKHELSNTSVFWQQIIKQDFNVDAEKPGIKKQGETNKAVYVRLFKESKKIYVGILHSVPPNYSIFNSQLKLITLNKAKHNLTLGPCGFENKFKVIKNTLAEIEKELDKAQVGFMAVNNATVAFEINLSRAKFLQLLNENKIHEIFSQVTKVYSIPLKPKEGSFHRDISVLKVDYEEGKLVENKKKPPTHKHGLKHHS
jgi:hypothetical protein